MEKPKTITKETLKIVIKAKSKIYVITKETIKYKGLHVHVYVHVHVYNKLKIMLLFYYIPLCIYHHSIAEF